jgi:uncharacterized protein YndB with AHSA1/START domain
MKFTIERRVEAGPEKVWGVIGDFSLSPGNGVEVRVIEPGAEGGTNLVRQVMVGTMSIRERIDEVVPGKSFTYSITKGTPTKSYTGRGEVARDGDGTLVRWSGDFAPRIPFTGAIVAAVAKRAVSKYLDAVLPKVHTSDRG